MIPGTLSLHPPATCFFPLSLRCNIETDIINENASRRHLRSRHPSGRACLSLQLARPFVGDFDRMKMQCDELNQRAAPARRVAPAHLSLCITIILRQNQSLLGHTISPVQISSSYQSIFAPKILLQQSKLGQKHDKLKRARSKQLRTKPRCRIAPRTALTCQSASSYSATVFFLPQRDIPSRGQVEMAAGTRNCATC